MTRRRVAGKRLYADEPNVIRELLGNDLAWQDDSAICASVDGDLWFEEHYNVELRTAKALCRQCPLLQPCRDYALAHPEVQGVWGATSYRERGEIRQGRRSA